MFLVYLGIYILFLLFIWGFFLVARIHAFKFKSFSKHIAKVTDALMIFLLILSILGFIFIYKISSSTTTQAVQDVFTNDEVFY